MRRGGKRKGRYPVSGLFGELFSGAASRLNMRNCIGETIGVIVHETTSAFQACDL